MQKEQVLMEYGSVAHCGQLDDETKEETIIARMSLELVHVRQPRISVVQY
jgi:hypothetical protein